MNKSKIYIAFSLLISRIIDMYTTIAFNFDSNQETSPIMSIFDGSWNSLIAYNIIITFFLLLFLILFSDNKFKIVEKKFISDFNSFKNYLSYLFFQKRVTFLQAITSNNFDVKLFLSLLAITLPIAMTVLGFIVSFHNLFLIYFNASLINYIPKHMVIHFVVLCLLIILLTTQWIFLKYRYKNILK